MGRVAPAACWAASDSFGGTWVENLLVRCADPSRQFLVSRTPDAGVAIRPGGSMRIGDFTMPKSLDAM